MVNTIFILDEYYKTQKILTVNGENTFFDDLYALDLSTGVESFEFSTNVDDIDESNYIMFYYHDQYKLFQITEVEQEHSEGKIITYCYGESACLELLNGAVRAFRKDEGFTCIEFFEHVLRGTGWSIGKYSSSLAEKSIPINVDKTTQIWSCIQDHMDVYGYELNTRVIYENGYVKHKLIDIYAEGELGNKTYKRFEYGRNVEGIIKKKDLYDWCTALIIEASAEIVGDNLDYNKDGYTKDATSDVILATKENEKYNLGREYVYGVFEDNTSPSGQEAIEKAVEELKRRAVPHFDYECTTVMTYKEYEDVSIGDTVYVIDHSFNPSITLEARVGRLEISFTDRNNCSCNLTNYKEVKSGIDMKLSAGIKDIVNTYLPITSAGIAEGAIIDGKIDTKYYEQITADIISGSKVVAEELIAGEAAIIYAQIGTLEAEDASIKNLVATKATIDELNATKANIQEINTNLLNADKAIIEDLNATNATIDNLGTKYANIDFANIGELAVEKLFADSGIIGDLVMKDGAVTGTLVGVTVKGDLIEGNTIVAEKLIIKGNDGLFYKLNTDGVSLSTEQTDYNSLNGSIITAKSVTAEKINVSDLVAFDATIGGFKIGNDKLYSGAKASVDNTTRGIYLDNTGQIAFGDKDNYIKYYKGSDDSYALEVAASKIRLEGQVTANGNFKIDTDGNMEAKNGKFTGNITGSTFASNNNEFQVLEDGTVKSESLVIDDLITTDSLNVNNINNPAYPQCLYEATTVYIDEDATDEQTSKMWQNGGVYQSISDMLAYAPRNLNGYTLTIDLQSNINTNISLSWFHSGQVNINFNGHTVYGHIYCYGASMVYRLYGQFNGQSADADPGKIMPYQGSQESGYYYCADFQYCQFAINNLELYPDKVHGENSCGVLAQRGAVGNIFEIHGMGSLRYLLRAEHASHVYVRETSGLTNNATFCATTGSIIGISNDYSQAGRSTEGNPYWTGSGGMIVCNQVLGMDKITFEGKENTGTNNNSNTNDQITVTETVKATSADTYRSTVYNSWKGDGTCRQGDYGYGDCQGCWFFGNNLYNTMNAGTVTKVVIRIKRQDGGVHAAQTMTVKSHNHTSRPSGAPTYTNTIGTCSCAVGSYIDLVITDTATINKLKACKGLGLSIGSTSSPYIVCSGTCKVIITYKTSAETATTAL